MLMKPLLKQFGLHIGYIQLWLPSNRRRNNQYTCPYGYEFITGLFKQVAFAKMSKIFSVFNDTMFFFGETNQV